VLILTENFQYKWLQKENMIHFNCRMGYWSGSMS